MKILVFSLFLFPVLTLGHHSSFCSVQNPFSCVLEGKNLGCELDTEWQINAFNKNVKNKKLIIKSICKSSKTHDIPAEIYTAILIKESGLRQYALSFNNDGSVDYGIAQINSATAEGYGLNKKRLFKDIKYAIDSGAMVLSWFKKTYGKREIIGGPGIIVELSVK